MSTEIKAQEELAIRYSTNNAAKSENKDILEATSLCRCGSSMTKFSKPSKFSNDGECVVCGFKFNPTQTFPNFYECTNLSLHGKGFRFCSRCCSNIQNYSCRKTIIKDIYNTNNLYFVYNDNKITGPYTKDEIIISFVLRRFKETKIHIKSANGQDKWISFQFPRQVVNNLNKHSEERGDQLLKYCENKNAAFKKRYPDLYTNLVQNALYGKLHQIVFPDFIPMEQNKLSFFQKLIMILGKSLAFFILIIGVLHCLPTSPLFMLVLGITFCLPGGQVELILSIFSVWCLFSGLFLVPIGATYIILNKTDMYLNEENKIQSWMIAWIVWGITTSMIPTPIVWAWYYAGKKHYVSKINKIIFHIIGVDFGGLDTGQLIQISTKHQTSIVVNKINYIIPGIIEVSVMTIFPALASTLPAAIAGFVANYIFQERFALKCSESITDNTLCFEKGYGCCDVVSSHDTKSFYTFVGSFASNILAAWAAIRICGYLVVNAFTTLSLYAKRRS